MTTVLELDEIQSLLDIPQLIDEIEAGFVLYSQGRVNVPPVGFLHFDDPPGDVHIKYGFVSGGDHYVLKMASGFYDNPALGFSRHYALDLGRTMYLLPYAATLLLGLVLPLRLALAVVLFLSVIIYPLALMRLLRALGKPRALCLLGLPLVYSSAFYWGFINFNLSIGLGIWGMALLLEPRRSWRGDVALAVLGGLIVFTHLYGLALLLGFAGLVMLLGPRRRLGLRLIPLAPAVVGAVVGSTGVVKRGSASRLWPLSVPTLLFQLLLPPEPWIKL